MHAAAVGSHVFHFETRSINRSIAIETKPRMSRSSVRDDLVWVELVESLSRLHSTCIPPHPVASFRRILVTELLTELLIDSDERPCKSRTLVAVVLRCNPSPEELHPPTT